MHPVARMLQQVLEGWDIPTPGGTLRVKEEDAMRLVPGSPYSVATNLAHACRWQRLWLGNLGIGPGQDWHQVCREDFREPLQGEWAACRKEFLDGLQAAHDFAREKGDELDSKSLDTLMKIAIHASYHLGQCNALRKLEKATRG